MLSPPGFGRLTLRLLVVEASTTLVLVSYCRLQVLAEYVVGRVVGVSLRKTSRIRTSALIRSVVGPFGNAQ